MKPEIKFLKAISNMVSRLQICKQACVVAISFRGVVNGQRLSYSPVYMKLQMFLNALSNSYDFLLVWLNQTNCAYFYICKLNFMISV